MQWYDHKEERITDSMEKSKVLPGCLKMEHVPEKNHVPKYVWPFAVKVLKG